MKATGARWAGIMLALGAVFCGVVAGYVFRESGGVAPFGVVVLVVSLACLGITALAWDSGGACSVSWDGGDNKFIVGQVYETVSCNLVDKDRYVAVVKDTDGYHWSCYVKKALPPVFVVRSGEERYVPFGTDFGKAVLPAESQTS